MIDPILPAKIRRSAYRQPDGQLGEAHTFYQIEGEDAWITETEYKRRVLALKAQAASKARTNQTEQTGKEN